MNVELIKAQKKDWKTLLNWRNDELTRKNSLSSETINTEEHKIWFFNSILSGKRIIYIVKIDNQNVGTVRVDKEEEGSVISWTVAPEHRGKGYAKKTVKKLIETLDGKIIAVIKKSNIASIKVAEYCNMSILKEKKELRYYFINK